MVILSFIYSESERRKFPCSHSYFFAFFIHFLNFLFSIIFFSKIKIWFSQLFMSGFFFHLFFRIFFSYCTGSDSLTTNFWCQVSVAFKASVLCSPIRLREPKNFWNHWRMIQIKKKKKVEWKKKNWKNNFLIELKKNDMQKIIESVTQWTLFRKRKSIFDVAPAPEHETRAGLSWTFRADWWTKINDIGKAQYIVTCM